MKTYVVTLFSETSHPYEDITKWCEEHFGPPAMPYENVKNTAKWAVHGGPRWSSLYQFFYEDDATLFKLTWT